MKHAVFAVSDLGLPPAREATERSYRGLFWCLVLVGLLVDQTSKYEVFRWLYPRAVEHQYTHGLGFVGQQDVIAGVFMLNVQFTGEAVDQSHRLAPLQMWSADMVPVVNHGALFGLGGKHRHLANGLFALVSLAAACAIVYWSLRRSTARDWALCTALGLILAGTLGNFYDRVVFGGVRDFLYFYWIEWPVFNVADCCLVCGAALLLFQAFLGRQTADEPETTPAASSMLTPAVAEVE